MEWRFEMSEREMHAGRWQKPENLFRYLRGIPNGKGAVARLLIPPKERPEEGPADLSGEM